MVRLSNPLLFRLQVSNSEVREADFLFWVSCFLFYKETYRKQRAFIRFGG
jgi:hypothetical protein